MTISDGTPSPPAAATGSTASRDQHGSDQRARALRRRQGRNSLFGVLLAVISLSMFVLVVALVVVFHALEAYHVIPGF